MTDDDQPKGQPNPLSFLKFRGRDERMQGIKDLLSSDTNNETKTRIPNVFAMTYFDSLGAWSSPTNQISIEFMGKTKTFPKTVEGLSEYFGMRYRINAISAKGLSREEYVHALSSYFTQQLETMGMANDMRMQEGAKKQAK
jgi:hypothetical protein